MEHSKTANGLRALDNMASGIDKIKADRIFSEQEKLAYKAGYKLRDKRE